MSGIKTKKKKETTKSQAKSLVPETPNTLELRGKYKP